MDYEVQVSKGLEHIGRVIKRNRKLKNLTQRILATELKCTDATISRYEKGKSDIQASTMIRISCLCDFNPIEYALPGDGTLSEKFKSIVDANGQKIQPFVPEHYSVMFDMQAGGQISEALYKQICKTFSNEEVLTIQPPTIKEPLAVQDIEAFNDYLKKPENSSKCKVLLYGYEIIKEADKGDFAFDVTVNLTKSILISLIRDHAGYIDKEMYKFYWKCMSSKRL